MIQNMSAPAEVDDGTEVGSQVHKFCMSTRFQKIESEYSNKKYHQKTACPGADKSVIKSYDQCEGSTEQKFKMWMPVFGNTFTKIFFCVGVYRHKDQHAKDHRLHKIITDQRYGIRTEHRRNQGDATHECDEFPLERYFSCIFQTSHGCSAKRRDFCCAQ